jgi:hypothetical protein
MDLISNEKEVKAYLTEKPQITFSKNIYRRFCDVNNKTLTYIPTSICNNEYTFRLTTNTFDLGKLQNHQITSIYLCEKNDKLKIEDIENVDIYAEKIDGSNKVVFHNYTANTLKFISTLFESANSDTVINLPHLNNILINEFKKQNYNIVIKVTIVKQLNPILMIKYVCLRDQEEIKRVNQTHSPILLRHLYEQTYNVTKGNNIVELNAVNIQCGMMMMTLQPNVSNADCEITGKFTSDAMVNLEFEINKYACNKKYSRLESNKNMYVLDALNNVETFYEYQSAGTFQFGEKNILMFNSNFNGNLVISFVCFDMLIYHPQIHFLDQVKEKHLVFFDLKKSKSDYCQ